MEYYIFETKEQQEYRYQAWFIYRYLRFNEHLQERFRKLFEDLESFFLKRQAILTGVDTARKYIDELLVYESERNLVITEHTVSFFNIEFDKNKYYLTLNATIIK